MKKRRIMENLFPLREKGRIMFRRSLSSPLICFSTIPLAVTMTNLQHSIKSFVAGKMADDKRGGAHPQSARMKVSAPGISAAHQYRIAVSLREDFSLIPDTQSKIRQLLK